MTVPTTEIANSDTAGDSPLSRRNLKGYEWWNLCVLGPRVWGCPVARQIAFYRSHLTANHLDAGVGTGFLLEKVLKEAAGDPARETTGSRRLVVVDQYQDLLDQALKRLSPFPVGEGLAMNLLEPLKLSGEPFASIAVMNVFHVLPGRMEQKASRVIRHLVPHLRLDGRLFGSTILGEDVDSPLHTRFATRYFNKRGAISNRTDSLGAVMEVLSKHFRIFNVEVVGNVVFFSGAGPKIPE